MRRIGLIGLMLALALGGARAATVTGTIAGWTNVSGYTTAVLTFVPDAPYLVRNETNLVILVRQTVAPSTNGTFSIYLEEGGWGVRLPGVLQSLPIVVPNEPTNTYVFSTLITNAPTFAWTNYVYPVPASALAFDAVSNNRATLNVTNLQLGGTNVIWPMAASQMGFAVVSNNAASFSVTNLTLRGTTNMIEFAGTNAAPASTNAVKWISVRVTGETNAYRIPLME